MEDCENNYDLETCEINIRSYRHISILPVISKLFAIKKIQSDRRENKSNRKNTFLIRIQDTTFTINQAYRIIELIKKAYEEK